MDTNFLKSLLLTVEVGSIAEAARTQNLTAAAVGQRIRALERELGERLFERVGAASKPTRACEILLPHIRSLVEEAESLRDRLDVTGMTGTLRVGAISTQIADTIPHVLRQFGKNCPDVHMHIVPGTSQQLYDALNEGRIDLAIVIRPDFEPPKTIRTVPFTTDNFVVISGIGRNGSFPELVAATPYIRYDRASWGGKKVEEYLDTIAARPTVLCDLDSLETIAVMVGNGMGFGIVPEWHGLRRHSSKLAITPIGARSFAREICICYTTPAKLPKVVDIFIDRCREVVADFRTSS